MKRVLFSSLVVRSSPSRGRTSTCDVEIIKKKAVRFGVLAIHVFGNQVKKREGKETKEEVVL